jgi:hypothetical protein
LGREKKVIAIYVLMYPMPEGRETQYMTDCLQECDELSSEKRNLLLRCFGRVFVLFIYVRTRNRQQRRCTEHDIVDRLVEDRF